MMRSMYAGVSGLRSHQVKMDVIGNNIANVNTVGFKASRVTFQEVYSQTLKPASAPSQAGGLGGTNPHQAGLGVSVASIDVLHTRGSVQRTDNATDLAIEGDGFFIVSDGTSRYYTRAGNFIVDRLGNLVTNNGLKVMGWTDREINQNTGIQSINTAGIPRQINLANLSMEAKATDMITFEGNLDNRTSVGETIQYSSSVFDSQGYEHKVNFIFTKEAANVWSWKMVPVADDNIKNTYSRNVTANVNAGATLTPSFSAKKPITYAHDINTVRVVSGTETKHFSFRVVNTQAEFDEISATLGEGQAVIFANGTNQISLAFGEDINGDLFVDFNDDPISFISPRVDSSVQPGLSGEYDVYGDGSLVIPAGQAHGIITFGDNGKINPARTFMNGDIQIIMNGDVSGASNIILNRDNMRFNPEKFTQYSDATTVKTAEVTGYAAGTLEAIGIDSSGRIIGIYSNGQSREDAVLAISKFSNPAGLMKIGDNLFQVTANSGDPNVGRAGVDGRGGINPGALEMSNVDLAKEFTEMIVAQRGFQANSRIITTSDELLQELVNLKR